VKKGFTSLPPGEMKSRGEYHHEITVVAPTGFASWWANTCASPSRAPPSGVPRPGAMATLRPYGRMQLM
jgi:hypothetical protein